MKKSAQLVLLWSLLALTTNAALPAQCAESAPQGSTASSNDTGLAKESATEAAPSHSRMLQAEIGATGHYDEPNLNSQVSTQAPVQAPPPPLYGQAGAGAPYYGQAMQPYQQPLYGQAMAQPPLYGQATGQPPLYGQAMNQAPFYGQAQQPSFGYQPPLQGNAYQQPPAMYQSNVSHGQLTIGVLGAEFGLLNNQIRQILPGSDLIRYGITPGDIIEAADGRPLRGKDMQAYIRGTPGTYVQLTILHRGQLVTIPVQRKDAREFQSYDGYFKKWAAKEKFW